MKQMSFESITGFERKTKRTRKRGFLDEMNLVVPRAELVALIAPHGRNVIPKVVARRLPLPHCCASTASSNSSICQTLLCDKLAWA